MHTVAMPHTNVKGFDRLNVVRRTLRRLLRLRKELQGARKSNCNCCRAGNAHEALQSSREYWLDALRCYGTGGLWHDEIMSPSFS